VSAYIFSNEVILYSLKTIQLDVQQCVGLRPLGAFPLRNGDIIHVRNKTPPGSRFRDALAIVDPACSPSGVALLIADACHASAGILLSG
jgi:hypothetical protein